MSVFNQMKMKSLTRKRKQKLQSLQDEYTPEQRLARLEKKELSSRTISSSMSLGQLVLLGAVVSALVVAGLSFMKGKDHTDDIATLNSTLQATKMQLMQEQVKVLELQAESNSSGIAFAFPAVFVDQVPPMGTTFVPYMIQETMDLFIIDTEEWFDENDDTAFEIRQSGVYQLGVNCLSLIMPTTLDAVYQVSFDTPSGLVCDGFATTDGLAQQTQVDTVTERFSWTLFGTVAINATVTEPALLRFCSEDPGLPLLCTVSGQRIADIPDSINQDAIYPRQ